MIRINLKLAVVMTVIINIVVFISKDVHAEANEKIIIIPEYERTLEQVVITLDAAHPDIRLQHSLLEKLPSYSEILLLAPVGNHLALKRSLESECFGDRVTILPFSTTWVDEGCLEFVVQESDSLKPERIKDRLPLQWGTLWAQDLFKAGCGQNGEVTVYIPPLHMAYWQENQKSTDKPISDNEYLFTLREQGIDVQRIPVVFSGGNILIDVCDGHSVAFCGADIIRHTHAVNNRFSEMAASPGNVTEILQKSLGVDEVVVIGLKQPSLMFHLDQTMLLLGDRKVAVLSVTGPLPEERKRRRMVEDVVSFIEKTVKILKKRGYTIIPLEITATDVLKFGYPTNGIAYTDVLTGARSVLFPIFHGKSDVSCSETDLRNIGRLTDAGFTVIPVYSASNELRGGPHCMINVLK